MTEYMIALFAIVAVSAMDRASFFTALVIGLNFCLNEVFVRQTGQYDPWLWFSLTDGACAALLMLNRFGRVGAAVAAIYCTQEIMHLAYFFSGRDSADVYWQSLTAMAFLQLLIVFGGAIHGGGRRLGYVRALRRISALDNPAHPRSSERGEAP